MKRDTRPNPERDAKALALRREGLRLREIAEIMGWSAPQSASSAVRRAERREREDKGGG